MTPTRRTYWIAVLVGLAGFTALVWHFSFTCDDAYITFRYAKNLALGNGLVFNPGESPPVEGYSNFLWTLWLAGWYALGASGDALASVANVFAIGSAVAVLALVTRLAQRRFDLDAPQTVATSLFLGTLAPFALWATGGLETMPFTLALCAAFERLLGDPERPRGVQAGLWAVGAGLLRADGALWVGVVLGLAGLTWLARRRRELLVATAATLAILVVGVGVHVLWRHAYYGEWLPNTARVKAGFSQMRLERGLYYVATLALTAPALALLPPLALVTRAGRGRGALDLTLQSIGVIAFGLAYAIYVGGDFMPMGRFVVPAMPFVALLFAAVVRSLAGRGSALALGFAGATIAVGVLLCVNVLRWPQSVLQGVHFRWNSTTARSEYEQWWFQRGQALDWVHIGRALTRCTRPGESIIRGPVGAVGYFSELHVYDLNGLVSLEVSALEERTVRASPGHDKHVAPDFFFHRRPTYLAAAVLDERVPVLAPLSPEVKRLLSEHKVQLERYPLPESEGFPAGHELRLFRMIWD